MTNQVIPTIVPLDVLAVREDTQAEIRVPERISVEKWWEMQRFYAATFSAVFNNLIWFIATQPLASEDDPAYKKNADQVLSEIAVEAEKIGLTRIVSQANRIRTKKLVLSTNEQIFSLLLEMRDCIVEEMSAYLFLSIGPTFKFYYLAPEKQVKPCVVAAFPSALRDIERGAQCLALDQPDAAVFHSMRILELGLNSLADQFGVPFENTNWQTVIDQVESKIKLINKTVGIQWKEEERFYSEAALGLRWLKNAWRNYAMHLRETYEMQEAGNIFFYVRTFMEHLSAKLTEPKPKA
jgi:hypothetical protein